MPLQGLYVTYRKDGTSTTSTHNILKVFQQVSKGIFKEFKESSINGLELHNGGQPFILDINGDMLTDFIYVSNEATPKIKVALGNSYNSQQFNITSFSDFVMSPADDPHCKAPSEDDLLATPNSNAYMDLDGDCIPDIFMQKTRKIPGTNQTESYHEIYAQKIWKDK